MGPYGKFCQSVAIQRSSNATPCLIILRLPLTAPSKWTLSDGGQKSALVQKLLEFGTPYSDDISIDDGFLHYEHYVETYKKLNDGIVPYWHAFRSHSMRWRERFPKAVYLISDTEVKIKPERECITHADVPEGLRGDLCAGVQFVKDDRAQKISIGNQLLQAELKDKAAAKVKDDEVAEKKAKAEEEKKAKEAIK